MVQQAHTTHDAVRAILSIDDPVTRDLAINGFLRDRRNSHLTIARKHIQRRGENPARYLDDILSIVLEQDYRLLQDTIADPSTLGDITNWSGLLYARCRNAVNQFFETGLGAPMTKMSGVMRRRAEMASTRQQLLAAHNCEPSDQEIVDHTNARLRATRKNAEKQGMICTINDLYTSTGLSELHENDQVETPQEDFLVHSTEGPVIVEAIIDDATAIHEDLGLLADAWLGDLYGPEPNGRVRTVAEIAELLDSSIATVIDGVETIKLRAQVVVAQIVGLQRSDYEGTPEAQSQAEVGE